MFLMGRAFEWAQTSNTNRWNPRASHQVPLDVGVCETEPQPSLSSSATSLYAQDSVSSASTIEGPSRGQRRQRPNSGPKRTVKRRNVVNPPKHDDTLVPEQINTDFSKFATNTGVASLAGTSVNPGAPLAPPSLVAAESSASIGAILKQSGATTGHSGVVTRSLGAGSLSNVSTQQSLDGFLYKTSLTYQYTF